MQFLYASQKLMFALWLTGTEDPWNFAQTPVLQRAWKELGI